MTVWYVWLEWKTVAGHYTSAAHLVNADSSDMAIDKAKTWMGVESKPRVVSCVNKGVANV